jgi:hypothetical protein
MDKDQPRRDEADEPFLRVDWNIKHIRLLHTAVSYYVERMYPKNIKDVGGEKEKMVAMQEMLYKMILEFNYHSQ